MMANLLSPAPANPPGRISQLLPSVKCSNCNQPVPLDQLGEHVCAPVSPQAPTLPKPSVSPNAATALLPTRLQGRIASPVSSSPSKPIPIVPRVSSPRDREPQQRPGPPSSSDERLRISTASSGLASYQSRMSPLARSDPDRLDTSSPLGRSRDPFAPGTGSPLRTRPPPGADFRARTISNAGSIASNHSSPSTPRPSFSSNREMPPAGNAGLPPSSSTNMGRSPPNMVLPPNPGPGPASNMGRPPIGYPSNPGPVPNRGPSPARFPPPAGPVNPPQRQMSYVPPSERDIDTKVGGQAGMAGVGRRGFAAAARAAMFVAASPQQMNAPGFQPRRPNGPTYLDTNAASRANETPPLSAGSGYSSHSSGPRSPIPQFESVPGPIATKVQQQRAPSPPRRFISPAPDPPKSPSFKPPTPITDPSASQTPVSPISSIRLPFFEKFKNILPSANTLSSPNTNTEDIPTPTANEPNNRNFRNNASNMNTKTPTAANPTPPLSRSESVVSSVSSKSSYGPSPPTRSMSINKGADKRPTSSSSASGSEYGLAYADSTDYEDDDDVKSESKRSVRALPAIPLTTSTSILRSGSTSTTGTNHVKFPSLSDRSDRSEERVGMPIPGGKHRKDSSVSSSVSNSLDSATGKKRSRATSSAVIAHALGLSQTPPSEYAKLGGPGVGLGRSVSGSSSGSGKSGYSRGLSIHTASGALGNGALDRLAQQDAAAGEKRPMFGLTKSKSTGSKKSFEGSVSGRGSGSGRGVDLQPALPIIPSLDKGKEKAKESAPPATVKTVGFAEDDTTLISPGGSKTQRSNTVQGPHSPESRPPKLPTRSRTSPLIDRESVRRERVKKQRSCVRCSKKIDDGRWVQVDSGGVLCERCWKNMYLPKCRRCNLPIEKQAVSSSDGQLKGKYHKECFNCHTCHKPFPDKTFYVYDGKPLCAYHYHEANESLCAAARCGQPIEGPCAVSHSGDKYHPEHMTCEHPGYPACRERLNEYWEVDGRMLCERHALKASAAGSDEGAEEEWVQSSRALKRVTRFIDLTQTGAGVGAGGGGGGDGVEGSDLR